MSEQENEEKKAETPTNSTPKPIQIVKIGTEEDNHAFTFNEENLNFVLSQVPIGWKVAVVSCVGAFRTGKSFLLSWFLRYLETHGSNKTSVPPLTEENGVEVLWYNNITTISPDSGFHWMGGAERQTTGMWVWNVPFFLPQPSGDDLAVLLIDTQGMFDHETTMAVTASIFGLSSLVSSYQIFNVDKRIQEDHLQQLALFSEYGRLAIKEETKQHAIKEKDIKKPFQQIEFLVRDWQNFDCDGEGELDKLEQEMEEYLESVIEERSAKDLQDTREQITSCFESIKCFLLTHPGRDVTKKKYGGEVNLIDPVFLRLLNRYCERVFDNLQPKQIHGRELVAAELFAYIKEYARLFTSGAKFPEASTMLEATAAANNVNATQLCLSVYKDGMENIAGSGSTRYMRVEELETSHRNLLSKALEVFDDIANFGNDKVIESCRLKVLKEIDEKFEMYVKLNEAKNPFAGMETIIIPAIIAILSLIMRKFADATCAGWSQTCKAGSEVLAETSSIVFFFMVIVSATKAREFSDFLAKLKSVYNAMMGNPAPVPVSNKEKHE